jgi:hypothetical protein
MLPTLPQMRFNTFVSLPLSFVENLFAMLRKGAGEIHFTVKAEEFSIRVNAFKVVDL